MRIVVVGGGIGGLALGLLLGPKGHEVTILERDAMTAPADADHAWTRWRRAGVAQFRHIHLFNARGRNLVRDRLPDVFGRLQDAGAGEVRLGGPDDDDLVRLTCRRTTYEWVLRRALLDGGQATVAGATRVAGLVGDGRGVRGVRLAGGTEIDADLVVDASGRSSRLPGWLAEIGAAPPEQSAVANGTVGYTRWYRLRQAEPAPLLRADLGYAVGVVAPADAGMFCVSFGCLGEDPVMSALRRANAFDAATSAIASIAPWTDPDRSTVESPVLFMPDRANRLMRPAGGGREITAGVVALGDAAMTTNPGYGRGVSLALVHAAGLVDALDEVGDAGDAPLAVARAVAGFTARELEPWYHAAVRADAARLAVGRRVLAGERWETIGGPGDDAEARFARGAPAAAERDPVVARAFHRAFQLLDPPSSYWGNPDIEARVEAVWQTMDHAPPPAPGPDHETMANLLATAP